MTKNCYQGAGAVSTSVEPNCSLPCPFPSTQTFMKSNQVDNLRDSKQVTNSSRAESCNGSRQALLGRPFPMMRGTNASLAKEHKIRNDLQGLALTLGGPASGNHAGS